ncbi:MAG TPA: LysE family translocator [Aliiroseovarius sp.]|nr:LysE family translocator [Aliiroseovarius sp.]
MLFETWLTFAAASAIILVIPGPTILTVLSYALGQGRRWALASVAGVALGDFIAMSASLAGLGALVATSATAFLVLKWVGAVYLVWMGVKLLRTAGSGGLVPVETPRELFMLVLMVLLKAIICQNMINLSLRKLAG